MKIELLLFASLREVCGLERSVVDADDDANVAQIAGAFLAARGVAADALPPFRFAVNESFVTADHVPRDGDRVAVLTPFAGG
jgi:molybdopterin converting factor small subunit